MKDKKDLLLLIGGIILFIGIILIIYFISTKTEDKYSADAIKFSKEYSTVDNDNVFVYKTSEEIVKILEKGTGIVYLGFPECPWCQSYVKILNEVAKENGLDKIFYLNILEDRKNNTEDYKKIVSLLKEYLDFDDQGNERVFVPDVTAVLDGKIVGHDNETATINSSEITPSEYWTAEKIASLKVKLAKMIEDSKSNICTTCNN